MARKDISMSKFTTFKLSNGVEVINTTPHPINFMNKEGLVTVVPPCGFILNASATTVDAEGPVPGIEFVRTVFVPQEQGLEFLENVPEGVLVIGSMIAAQAYAGKVACLTPCPGFERVAPADKRMSEDKFTIY